MKKTCLITRICIVLLVLINSSAFSQAGKALNFDGTNDFVNVNTTLGNFGTGDATLEAWFKTGSIAAQQTILGKRNDNAHGNFINLEVLASGKISVEFDENVGGTVYQALLSNASVNDNTWHHVAVIRQGNNLLMYIDGILDNNNTSSGTANINNANSFCIGVRQQGGGVNTGYFNGSIDEVRIWSRVLSQSEIINNMNCELSAAGQISLNALYNFNQGIAGGSNPAVTSLTDGAGGNTGTLNGFALSGSTSNWVAPGGTKPPVITGFLPSSGPIGSSVTITGTGFNASPAQNIVYFGATKATVTAASSTSLTVIVPLGATYQYISVTTSGLCNLTAYSSMPFLVTLAGNIAFANKVDFAVTNFPYMATISDIDGDGKPDLAVNNYQANTMSVLRNTSSSGTVNFATTVDFATAANNPFTMTSGDLDGDGRHDVAVANTGGSLVSVFRNTSIPGTISFATRLDFTAGLGPSGVVIGDIDADGKPELIVANVSSSAVSVFRNTSTPGAISFAARIDFATSSQPYSVVIGDLNGDGKRDLAIANQTGNLITILQSTSVTGTISFAPLVNLVTGLDPITIAMGDIDGDGRLDLATGNNGDGKVSVHRNTSASGVLSFAPKQDFNTGSTVVTIGARGVNIGDIDGDGKPDLAVSNYNTNTVSVLKSTSTIGAISFAPYVDLATGINPRSVYIGDLDGDGKPDLSAVNQGSNSISTFRQVELPQGSLTANGPLCVSGTGQLTWTATTGTDPYTIIYNDGVANRTVTNVLSGVPFNVFTNPVTSTTNYSLVSVTYANFATRTSGFTVGSAQVSILTPPAFSACATNQTVNTLVGTCSAPVSYTVTATGTPAPVLTYVFTGATTGSGSGTGSGSTFNKGTTFVVITASNGCGSNATCSFNVVVVDAQPPVISCPGTQAVSVGVQVVDQQNLSINAGAGSTDQWQSFTAGITGPLVQLELGVGSPVNPLSSPGTIRIYSGAGTGGTLLATEAVTFVPVSSGGVQTFSFASPANLVAGNVYSYRISVPTVSISWISLSTLNPYAGGEASNVNTWDFKFRTFIATTGCTALLGNYTGLATKSDNCGIPVVTQSPPAGSVIPLGTTVVTLTATDAAGLTAGCTFNVIASDHILPVLAPPANQLIITEPGLCTAGFSINDPLFDNCSGSLWGYSSTGATILTSSGNTIADGTGSGSLTFNKGVTTVTLTGTDGTNAAVSLSFTVTVIDNQAPVLANPGNQTTTTTPGFCSGNYTIADPVSDNCSSSLWGYSTTGATTLTSSGNTIADGTGSGILTFNKGITTVTLTGTDGTTAATSISFTVTVNDNLPPVISCPTDISVNVLNRVLIAQYPLLTNLTDASSHFGPVSLFGYTTPPAPPSPGNPLCQNGIYGSPNGQVISTPAISSLNTSSFEFDVDFMLSGYPTSGFAGAPVIIIGQGFRWLGINVNNTGFAGIKWNNSNTSYSATHLNLNQWYTARLNFSANTARLYLDGVLVHTVTTGVLNTSTNRDFLTVDFSTGNALNGCIRNLVIHNMNTDVCSYNGTIGAAIATDNCTAVIVSGPIPAGPYNLGTTSVTWTATDASGNIATCNQLVTVIDNIKPALATPGNQALVTAPGLCTGNYTIADPVSDNCSSPLWGYSTTGATTLTSSGNTIPDGSGSGTLTFNRGVTNVTLTGTDGTNAATTVSFTVTVTDNQAPTLAGPGDQAFVTAPGLCTASYTIADPVSDQCNGALWGYSTTGATTLTSSGNTIADGTGSGTLTFNKGVTTVTLTGTDGTNAATIISFTVTVTDDQAPVLANPGNQAFTTTPGLCSRDYTLADPVSDNCNGSLWGYSTTGATSLTSSGNTIADGTGSGTLTFNKGVTTVTLTGTDGTNAATSISFTITVSDNEAPVVTCKPVVVSLNTSGNGFIIPADVYQSGSDNCGVINLVSVSPNSFTCENMGANLVLLTVDDGNGNTNTCTATVTVQDNLPPVITGCPANIVSPTSCDVAVSWTPPSVSDNCSYIVVNNKNPGDIFPPGITTVTYTATDPSGNVSTCSFTVTVNPMMINATVTSPKCNGQVNGSITTTLTNGTPPFTYLWNTGQTTSGRTNLGAGSYTVTVTDANGCTKSGTFAVAAPALLIVTGQTTNVTCNGSANGTATALPAGGTPPYTYSWNTPLPQFTQTITGLAPGSYICTIKDANLCVKSLNAVISQPAALNLTIASTNVTLVGGSNGTATANPTGGTAPYSYLWSNSKTTKTITGLMANTYTVTVTDAKGCTKSGSVSISQPARLEDASALGDGAPAVFTFYPNPTSAVGWIEAEATSDSEALINLFDATGKKVYEKTVHLIIGNNKSEIDFTFFAPGIYSLQIISGDASRMIRVIKE